MRVIVADDEEIIRTGIVELIPWDALGYQVVGEAEDGEEALSLITEQKPDVVITDIKMPFITGLELLKSIKDKYESLYTILLTGYDEFKFAQEAVKNGAYAYLLKPVNPTELEKLLIEIREDYKKKQAIRNYVKELKTEISFKKMLFGLGNSSDVASFLSEYGYNIDALYFNAFILEIDDYLTLSQSEYADWMESAQSIIYEIITSESEKVSQAIILENQGFTFIIIAWEDSAQKLKRSIAETIDKIRRLISPKAISLTVAIGGAYKGMENIKRSYEEAIKALSMKFLLGKNEDIHYNDFIDKIKQQKIIALNLDDIAAKINFESRDDITRSFDALMDAIKERGAYSYIYLQLVITNIYIHSLQLLRKAEVDIDKAFGNPIQKFESILAKETADERINGVRELLLEMYTIIESSRSNSFSGFIMKAEEYIGENSSKKNLSLSDVTKHVSVSQAHFCVEFKKKTGETFIDYLTRMRMEKARELLMLSDRKIYEISEMVGYDNATYFSTLFKKCYNVSPSEFKSAIR